MSRQDLREGAVQIFGACGSDAAASHAMRKATAESTKTTPEVTNTTSEVTNTTPESTNTTPESTNTVHHCAHVFGAEWWLRP
jgi:hypothetical protein